ncbi:MAG: AAA family ATPase [Clostridium sp.]
MILDIKNCNNIDTGKIEIEEGKLNIKYAINGTGKSTIAHALEKMNEGLLDELRPFKYIGDGIVEHNPSVSINSTIKNIAIFDESYINSYTFQKEEVLKNSFEIFIKTETYDNRMQEINSLLCAITETFKDNPEIDKLLDDLSKFEESFGKAKNGYSKAGDLGKGLAKGNKLEDVPEELVEYEPFLKSEKGSINWLKWQAEGKNYIDIGKKCPYCVSKITTPKATILRVSEEYDTKYLAALGKVIEIFKSLSHYLDKDTESAINSIIINTNGITSEQIGFLKSVKEETNRLKETLISLKYMGFATLKDVDKVVDELLKKKIDLKFYPKLKSEYTENKINKINSSLQDVIDKAGMLQGQVAKQKILIKTTIEKYKEEINGFLNSAGYQYEVDIVPVENEKYKLVLRWSSDSENAVLVREHLSYGERNAFALVLFMYQALKEEADFIILDDPISSFDTNKKYAILKMLFMGKVSLRGKTVLMLTHDFEPIIDSIYNMKQYFQPAPVACFLGNINGVLEEKSINKENIKSFFEICYDNMDKSINILHKLIYLRRYLEITEAKGLAWQMVSNVFHKDRDKPIIKLEGEENSCDMNPYEYNMAEKEIQEHITEFEYQKVYDMVKNTDELIKVYNQCKSGYEKVQIYRLIFDGSQENGSALKKYVDATFHVQNDYLFQLNPREYKIVPQYILDFCDEAISCIS